MISGVKVAWLILVAVMVLAAGQARAQGLGQIPTPPEVVEHVKALDAVAFFSKAPGGPNTERFVRMLLVSSPPGQMTAWGRLGSVQDGRLCGWVEGLLIVAMSLDRHLQAADANLGSWRETLHSELQIHWALLRALRAERCGGEGGKAAESELRAVGEKLGRFVRGERLHMEGVGDVGPVPVSGARAEQIGADWVRLRTSEVVAAQLGPMWQQRLAEESVARAYDAALANQGLLSAPLMAPFGVSAKAAASAARLVPAVVH